jgi:MFS family permease
LWALIAGNFLQVMIGGSFFQSVLPPFALEHSPVGASVIGIVVFVNTFFVVVAQLPATRVVARMRRTRALLATSVTFAVGLLLVLLATLTRSTLAGGAVLVAVGIVIAIAECGQFIVIGPLIAEIAPPHLLGRYMSLYQLSFLAGIALGPAAGGALLAASPNVIWWGGAIVMLLTGVGFMWLGDRIPDPLVPKKVGAAGIVGR